MAPFDCPVALLRSFQQAECAQQPSPHLMDHQDKIDSDKRSVLVDWMVDVALELTLQDESLFLAINLLDRTLMRSIISVDDFQVLGTACLWIAAKYCEQCAISGPEMVASFTVGDDTVKDLLSYEQNVLKLLDFEIGAVTSLDILHCLLTASAAAIHRSSCPNRLPAAPVPSPAPLVPPTTSALRCEPSFYQPEASASCPDFNPISYCSPADPHYEFTTEFTTSRLSECPLIMRRISASDDYDPSLVRMESNMTHQRYASGAAAAAAAAGQEADQKLTHGHPSAQSLHDDPPYDMCVGSSFSEPGTRAHCLHEGSPYSMCIASSLSEPGYELTLKGRSSCSEAAAAAAAAAGARYPNLPHSSSHMDLCASLDSWDSSDSTIHMSRAPVAHLNPPQGTMEHAFASTTTTQTHSRCCAHGTEQTLASPAMQDVTRIAKFFCELSLMDHRMSHWRCSQIASAALLLAHSHVGVLAHVSGGGSWLEEEMQTMVGYSTESLRPVIACLEELQQRYTKNTEHGLTAISHKYCDEAEEEEEDDEEEEE